LSDELELKNFYAKLLELQANYQNLVNKSPFVSLVDLNKMIDEDLTILHKEFKLKTSFDDFLNSIKSNFFLNFFFFFLHNQIDLFNLFYQILKKNIKDIEFDYVFLHNVVDETQVKSPDLITVLPETNT
jgi:hypothetical protein